MATAYNIRDVLQRGGIAERQVLADPGNAGTILVTKDLGVVTLASAGTATLQAADQLPLGTNVLVLAQAAVTVNSVVLADGEWAEFQVVLNSSGVHAWGLISSAPITDNVVTADTASSATGTAQVSAGTDRTIEDATAVEITGDISAYNETTFKALLTALDGFGLITDSTTT